MVCDAIATAARRIGAHYAVRLRAIGLSFAMLQVLGELEREDGRNPGALADRLAARGSSMTELLDRLAEQRLIERRDDPDDRRALRVHLTDRGRVRHRQARAVVARFNRELARRLSPPELHAFMRVMSMIGELTAEPPPAGDTPATWAAR